MNDNKGLYLKKVENKKYYEGGAHFRYSKLVKVLQKLTLSIPSNRLGTPPSKIEEKSKNNHENNISQLNSSRKHKNTNLFLSSNSKNNKLEKKIEIFDYKNNKDFKSNNSSNFNLFLSNKKPSNRNKFILKPIDNSRINSEENDQIKVTIVDRNDSDRNNKFMKTKVNKEGIKEFLIYLKKIIIYVFLNNLIWLSYNLIVNITLSYIIFYLIMKFF